MILNLNLVGVVDVADERVHPVLVVGVGPLGTQMGEGGRGVQQIGVVEVLDFVRSLLFVREERQTERNDREECE